MKTIDLLTSDEEENVPKINKASAVSKVIIVYKFKRILLNISAISQLLVLNRKAKFL